ncbi:tyrosine-type recombinase/integrase, partial [bacterium]|nr:tyrosine-type recombinase/integrase [bacterium]
MDERVARYLEHVRFEKRLAQRTCTLYAIDLQTWASAAELALTDVQTPHVRRWVAQMHSAGRSGRGIALILSGWRGFYHWLAREGLIQHNPIQGVRAPKAAKPLPKALGVDEAVQLASHVQDADAPWLEARDAAMVELLYATGARVAELCGLDVSDIDYDRQTIRVLGKGNKERTIPLGNPAMKALNVWL